VVLTLSAATLALVALRAGFVPAHRASRVDPDEGVEIRIARWESALVNHFKRHLAEGTDHPKVRSIDVVAGDAADE